MLKILIVEDENEIRLSLANFLRKRGYDVSEAENGQHALERLKQVEADIVISDIRMPVLDGIGLLKVIRERHAQTDVVLVTAFQDIDTAIEAARHQAADYIRKPYDLDDMLHTVRRLAQQRDLKRQVELQREQLHRSHRLASLGLLASSIMHHINNPTATIRGHADYLQRKMATMQENAEVVATLQRADLDARKIAETAQWIVEGCDRIADIISRTAIFSAGRPATGGCRIDEALERALAHIRRNEQRIQFNRLLPEQSLMVALQGEELTQIMIHLLSNASEALTGQSDAQVTVVARQHPGKLPVELAVLDNGPGIAPELRGHIFEPLISSHNDRPGRGMGLFIVHQLVTGVGGTIDCGSGPDGKGTGFTLRLPAPAAA